MAEQSIEKAASIIPSINSAQDYWFIRTQGGLYYDAFITNNYVAIGYDEIGLGVLSQAKDRSPASVESLKEVVENAYQDESRPAYVVAQLLDFTYRVKKGDLVIVPSDSTDLISIGEVTETPVYLQKGQESESDNCPFIKRKKVRWLKKNLNLWRLDSELLKLKFARRAVNQIDPDLAKIVDGIVTPLFVKNDAGHLSLEVKREENISAVGLFETWIELINLTEEFGRDASLDIQKEDFDVRINVQSPGTIEFISRSIVGILVLATLVASITGAEIETNLRLFTFKFKTDGLLKRISDWKDRKVGRERQKVLKEKLEKMELSTDEIVKLLGDIDNSDS